MTKLNRFLISICFCIPFLTILGCTTPSTKPLNSSSFVNNFELIKAKVNGSTANITVQHNKVSGPTRFELIPGQACLESLPAQCSATIVRLDDQSYEKKLIETTFEVNLEKIFGYKNQVIVTVEAPNKSISIKY